MPSPQAAGIDLAVAAIASAYKSAGLPPRETPEVRAVVSFRAGSIDLVGAAAYFR